METFKLKGTSIIAQILGTSDARFAVAVTDMGPSDLHLSRVGFATYSDAMHYAVTSAQRIELAARARA